MRYVPMSTKDEWHCPRCGKKRTEELRVNNYGDNDSFYLDKLLRKIKGK